MKTIVAAGARPNILRIFAGEIYVMRNFRSPIQEAFDSPVEIQE
jgi:hypothetical protein